ncbi:MAG: PhzF family phenazine biosynthesis protein [Pirellulales bacterium]|nr:PhzF family phenazine biosynthesis protein [Pirellulales bacterium]
MRISLYQVDAFTSRVFGGNPAAVCPLERWLPAAVLQGLAAENNLSETAFLVGGAGRYELRWFTPTIEVDLCGHATLAAAYVVFEHLEPGRVHVEFTSRSGPLHVRRKGARLVLDFPARPPQPCVTPPALLAGLDRAPRAVLRSRDYLAVYDSAAEIRALRPDFRRLAELDALGLIVTAPGEETDFVSRFFAPQSGIDEDPVTGSAHCTLVPYWAEVLGKTELTARQLSTRGGELWCRLAGERVDIAGEAVLYLRGEVLADLPG